MRNLRNVLQSQFDLGAELLLDLVDVEIGHILHYRLSGIGSIRAHHWEEVAVLIHKAGTVCKWSPLYVLPFACDGKMYTYIKSGILLQHLYSLWEPGTYNQYFG